MAVDPACGNESPSANRHKSKPRASRFEVPHRERPEDRKSHRFSTLIRYPPRGWKKCGNSGFVDRRVLSVARER